MATRSTHMGSAAASEVLTAANYNKNGGGCIAYATQTSTQGSITTETALTSLTTSPTLVASRLYLALIIVHAKSDTSADRIRVRLKRDGTTINDCRLPDTTANAADTFFTFALVVGASAGASTFAGTIERSSGSGTVSTESSATTPGVLAVFDLGASF